MEDHGLAVLHEEVFVGGHGGDFAAVIGLDLAALGMQQEGAASNAAGLRLDQAEHQLHGNGGINGAASGLEHLKACIRCQRVGRSHGVLFVGPAGLVGPAGAAFGLVGCGRGRVVEGRGAGTCSQQGGCRQCADLQCMPRAPCDRSARLASGFKILWCLVCHGGVASLYL
ncbi:hypothetical protein D3C71_1546170 [compost metagenome]